MTANRVRKSAPMVSVNLVEEITSRCLIEITENKSEFCGSEWLRIPHRSRATRTDAAMRVRKSETLQVAALDAGERGGVEGAGGRVVAGRLLGLELDLRVRRHQPVRDRHALEDLDAGRENRVVFHVRHGHEAVDAGDAEPVEHVRHELLEARVLHAGDAFGALEIGRGLIAALLPLPGVVDEEFGD